MKYSESIEINLPQDKVVALFDNPNNYQYWMDGLLGQELLSGEAGKEGAKTRLKFKMGNREMEMTETLVKRNPPSNFIFNYDAKGVHNIVTIHFEELGPNKTKYTTGQEFKFGFFMNILAFFMQGAFKKQSKKVLESFKNFAEKAAK